MASIPVDKKKRGRGRPKTGQKPAISARIKPEVLRRLDDFQKEHGGSRSDAIEALLERGLNEK